MMFITPSYALEPSDERCGVIIPDSKKPSVHLRYDGKTIWIDGFSVLRQTRWSNVFTFHPPIGLKIVWIVCERPTVTPDPLDYRVLLAGYPLLLVHGNSTQSFYVDERGHLGGAGDGSEHGDISTWSDFFQNYDLRNLPPTTSLQFTDKY
jgi:hypothetical protein